MKAVILAAGRGSRLSPYSDILPKPLMPIEKNRDGAFVSISQKLIGQIKNAGIDQITLVVNYKAGLVLDHLKDGADLGVKISYVYQGELDGNAGAWFRAQHLASDGPVLITDCDNFVSDDRLFAKLRSLHEEEAAAVTVAVCPVEDVTKYAIIKTDTSGQAADIFEKPKSSEGWGNLAKTGMMIISAEIAQQGKGFARAPGGEFTTTAIIKSCIEQSKKVVLLPVEGAFHDIGTWSEYIPLFKKNL